MVLLSGSTARTRLSRDSDSTISLPAADGTWPPTSPVLPPCGTIGVWVPLASFRMAETSATLPGRSTIDVAPWNLSRGSLR